MTLDEVLTIANRAYHERRLTDIEPKYISDLRDVAEYIWTNADKFRRVEKVAALEDTESRCEMLLSQNDSLESENSELSYENDALRDERNKLEAEMAEKDKALADLMVELHKLKKAT